MNHLTKTRRDLSSSTKNTIMAAFRNVLKMAREEGVIDVVPDTPRAKQRDNTRPFFRFYPLVSRKDDDRRRSRYGERDGAPARHYSRGACHRWLYDIICS